MNQSDPKGFAAHIEQLISDTCAAIDSAYLSEDFLKSANESFDRIPILRDLGSQAEKDGNTTDPA
jgi:hypothetical protein